MIPIKDPLTNSGTPILIVTAVEVEREAVLRGLSRSHAAGIDVLASGAGPVSAAASTAAALSMAAVTYNLVISAGIGGGFPGRAEIGSLVLASKIVSADLGAETPNGLLSLDELGFGSSSVAASDTWNKRLLRALASEQLEASLAPAITVSTATGTAATAELRTRLVPGAASEGMEGYGVAIAASQQGIPVTELRAISNAVGPRDRSAWRIDVALQALETAIWAIAKSLKSEQPGKAD